MSILLSLSLSLSSGSTCWPPSQGRLPRQPQRPLFISELRDARQKALDDNILLALLGTQSRDRLQRTDERLGEIRDGRPRVPASRRVSFRLARNARNICANARRLALMQCAQAGHLWGFKAQGWQIR